MPAFMFQCYQRIPPNFLAKSAGVYSMTQGVTTHLEGMGSVLVYVLVGAFCGLLAGLMLAHVLRYLSMVLGRNLGGYQWVIYGALAGAFFFGWLAALTDRE
jgi:hypothetical protein